MPEPLTPDTILDTAEGVLRRFGSAKSSVVDVARALGVSHGSVYRHFPSKAALRDALLERWLARLEEPLEVARSSQGSAVDRLSRWLYALAASTQGMVRADPELFATFQEQTAELSDVVAARIDRLTDQAAEIIAAGMAAGELAPGDAAEVGRAVLRATAWFHHPALAAEWADAGSADDLDDVVDLVLRGVVART